MWTVEMLSNMVQELIGEPVGGFYNISQRLAHLTQAQNELVDETLAMMKSVSFQLTATVFWYQLPDDFQRFGDRQPYLKDDTSTSSLQVVPPLFMDAEYPGWHTGRQSGTPRYIVQDDDTFYLYPTPDRAYTMNFNYVQIPDELTAMDDIPFNGRKDLNRYAPALAYKVAFLHMLPRSPGLAQIYNDLYIQEEKKMRHFTRTNPQKPQSIYPIEHPKPGMGGGAGTTPDDDGGTVDYTSPPTADSDVWTADQE